MKRSKFIEEQVIAILREQEAGAKTADVCRSSSVKKSIRWIDFSAERDQHGDSLFLEGEVRGHGRFRWSPLRAPLVRATMATRLKALEAENAKLKRLYAEAMLDNAGLKDLLSSKW